MYSRVFIIRFLFLFLFIFVLCLSSLTKSDIKEGADGDDEVVELELEPDLGLEPELKLEPELELEPEPEPVITTSIPTTSTSTPTTTTSKPTPTTSIPTTTTSTPTTTTSTPTTSIPTTSISKTPPYITPDGYYYKTSEDYYKAKDALYNIANKDSKNVTSINNTPDKKYQEKNKYKYRQDVSKDMNIEYHKPEDQLRKELDQPLEMTYVYDKKGNKILYPSPKIQGNITYHVPGSYPFGSINYVPKYADSIFLSKSTGLSTVTTLPKNAQMKGGFCNYYKNNPDKIEEYCKKTDVNKCASTNCCTLLGGSTCVAGNENGPTNKAHYNNIYIRNKDYYYYQGKCYGNC